MVAFGAVALVVGASFSKRTEGTVRAVPTTAASIIPTTITQATVPAIPPPPAAPPAAAPAAPPALSHSTQDMTLSYRLENLASLLQ